MTMSAESPRKTSGRGGHVISPQPVSDPSIIESVAGFINEVVPQAYTSLPAGEGKESITWARFEYGDINDPALYPDTADDRSSASPLLLVLGYGSGVQVWAIPANGEATEVLSWRQGVVRTLRVLPTPLADSPVPDTFSHKRPLVALCDSAGPGPQFCSLSFISLRCGDQVKSIKFKNPVSDVLANRRSVVVTFPERIAVFDACTLEDRLTVTTCYPCPGPNPNPISLGSRWLAYAERQFLHSRRSSGGTEGEGVQSYTATVLHAAKSLGKGLRELGETVASSLTGTGATGPQRMPPGVAGVPGGMPGASCDALQPGVVTILDAQGVSSSRGDDLRAGDAVVSNADLMVAHFAAHTEPIVALQFDPSGMLLLTADKRGHDFHLFRVQPHPGGSSLAAVHHLYVLHRGDTTAKVQDVAFASDSRWVAVSTLRGTTHVFPVTPYGGPVGIRTHTTPHVVNRLSRFHRSAGLTADGRNSPVPTVCTGSVVGSYEATVLPPAMPYPNPRLPPYPHPTVINPLAQIRQPITHILSGMAPMSPSVFSQQAYHRNPSARTLGRSQSVSDENVAGSGVPLRVAACFAAPRAWLVSSPTGPREGANRAHKRCVDSLFIMACHGCLIEYDLEPRHISGIPKEKICDDTAIELEVKAKAQWMLLRPPHSSELQPPLPASNPLMVLPDHLPPASESRPDDVDERWLSQVEILTHAGPHRRLWMGPQFTFKTYTTTSVGAPLSLLETEAVEVGTGIGTRPARSNPVNMPLSGRPVVPVLIESGSASSYEQSPRMTETYGDGDSDGSAGPGDTQLREDLADAMMESPGVPIRDTGRRTVIAMHSKRTMIPIEKVVNPVGTVITVAVPSDEEVGGPPSPVLAGRNCERVLPADIGKVEVDVVKWSAASKQPVSGVGNKEQITSHQVSGQLPSKRESRHKPWYKGDPLLSQNVDSKIDLNPRISLKDNALSCKMNDSVVNVSKIKKSERKQLSESISNEKESEKVGEKGILKEPPNRLAKDELDISCIVAERSKRGKCIDALKYQTKFVSEELSSGLSEQPVQVVKDPSPEKNVSALRSKDETRGVKSSTFLLNLNRNEKSGQCCAETAKVKTEEKSVIKRSKRNGNKKKDIDESAPIRDDYLKNKEEDELASFVNVAKKVDAGECVESHQGRSSTDGAVSTKSSSVGESPVPNEGKLPVTKGLKLNKESSGDVNRRTKKWSGERSVNQDTEDDLGYISSKVDFSGSKVEESSGKEEINVCGKDSATCFTLKLRTKPGGCSSRKNKRVEETDTALLNLEKQEDDREPSEDISPVVTKPSFLEQKEEKEKDESLCEEYLLKPKEKDMFSTQLNLPPLKSWSSIVSSSPKDRKMKTEEESEEERNRLWSDIRSVDLKPDILVDDLGFGEEKVKRDVSASDSAGSEVSYSDAVDRKEDAKNNNHEEEEEETFVSALPCVEVATSLAPQRTWSSIVSSAKPGTSSSTDEGSGGYDSNESKESADLALDELEERHSSKSVSSEMVTASESLSASSLVTPLEEETSGNLSKSTHEDEPGSDPVSSSTSSARKNRRTKKKRR